MSRWTRPPACETCNDFRRVECRHKVETCPACGHLVDDAYADLRRGRYRDTHGLPEITVADLSPTEWEEFTRLRTAYPDASKLTVLGWLEGRRYHPRDDPQFLEDAETELVAWLGSRSEAA
jgi:hypothetical protein